MSYHCDGSGFIKMKFTSVEFRLHCTDIGYPTKRDAADNCLYSDRRLLYKMCGRGGNGLRRKRSGAAMT